jgi:hypothetical protein
MKSLKSLNFGANEVLQRNEMKSVLGSGGPGPHLMYACDPKKTPGCNCFESWYYENGWKAKITCMDSTLR